MATDDTKQRPPRPGKAKAGKHFPCDIITLPQMLRIPAFKLSEKDIAELLTDASRNSLTGAELKKFSEWMSFAIDSYKGAKIELDLRKISQIRRRLEHLRKHSFLLLTGFDKWEDIEGREFGAHSGLSNGLQNLDEISRHLLDAKGAKRNQLQTDLLKLSEASSNALLSLRDLPHVLPRWAEQNFLHTMAIIFRDVLGITPTDSAKGDFAKFVHRAAKIADVRKVGKDAIGKAVDTLNWRNVIRTVAKKGPGRPKATYKKIPVSFIRPFVVGKTDDGEDIIVTESD